jgi:hypothetical protein
MAPRTIRVRPPRSWSLTPITILKRKIKGPGGRDDLFLGFVPYHFKKVFVRSVNAIEEF